ncbi:isochorismatase family protein [Streptomyces sasae]|uniref:isochorismatase family protein n=1 Tax=Streptomyces sasae TaxID=1266772 RepID=UPI00292E0579|nr:isochorismatase family protein [Streptomyces sasae]
MPDTALLIIDMQRALLKDAHDGEACLDRVADLAARARSADVPVIYLRQRLDQVPAEWLEVHPTLTPEPTDVVLDKDSADSFLGTALSKVLEERAVRRLVVTGYASDFCVDSTSRSALSHGYDLVLAADGHTTMERPDGAAPTAAQIVAHHNVIFSVIQYAGRSVTVAPAAEIRFDT